MKTLKLVFLFTTLALFAQLGFAQEKSETIKVSGNCGMCKNKIETAAKTAGATYALWNKDSKELKVKYNNKSSDAAKIQQSIAAVGYDTESYKATDETYNKLHSCCKYERAPVAGTSNVGSDANAQFSNASLQAGGLTCSMCSKAVQIAIENVPFVEKVMADIENQQYNITFKPSVAVNFDDLSKAVEDAGFSVTSFKFSVDVNNIKAEKDKHIQIGDKYFHLLNTSGQQLKGTTNFTLVDKAFLPAKDFKKHASTSKMMCVQTGKAEACCSKGIAPGSRIYHVIL